MLSMRVQAKWLCFDLGLSKQNKSNLSMGNTFLEDPFADVQPEVTRSAEGSSIIFLSLSR